MFCLCIPFVIILVVVLRFVSLYVLHSFVMYLYVLSLSFCHYTFCHRIIKIERRLWCVIQGGVFVTRRQGGEEKIFDVCYKADCGRCVKKRWKGEYDVRRTH